ncbi:MAG: HAD-IB family phosphatase [Nanoarchaeota archaeon]|nr:HAD-IB family phosphatase [Nanoarchaeota archaeon]
MAYKLICFDMDGVIFKDINFWIELHKKFGTLEQGIKLTEKYLHNNYKKLVEEVVVKLWKGKNAKPYYELVNSLEYLQGVQKVFNHVKKKGLISAIISASSIDVARRFQQDYGVDHIFANELIIKDGKVSGEFIWPIGVGKHKKAEIIRHLCKDLGIQKKEVIYIGDSDTDIEAFKEVGLSIAFNSSSDQLKKVATYVVESNNLADVLPYLKDKK